MTMGAPNASRKRMKKSSVLEICVFFTLCASDESMDQSLFFAGAGVSI
jgi:hypothetical protein